MALDIKREMVALDQKNRDFLDQLTDDEKKQFSTYLMIRWGATVTGDTDLQEYYLIACNERLNKNFFAINKTKHDKLNWLAATTISPGMGNMYHQWISAPKRGSGNSKVEKFLAKQFPDMKPSDVTMLASINDLKAVKEMAKQLGMSPEQIKKELG